MPRKMYLGSSHTAPWPSIIRQSPSMWPLPSSSRSTVRKWPAASSQIRNHGHRGRMISMSIQLLQEPILDAREQQHGFKFYGCAPASGCARLCCHFSRSNLPGASLKCLISTKPRALPLQNLHRSHVVGIWNRNFEHRGSKGQIQMHNATG